MVDITAKSILDSESSNGGNNSRLMTMLTRYPKFIHGEHLRHRAFSFSVSSSRAIPVAKNLEEVRNDNLRAGPIWWGQEQKGMQSGDELSSTEELNLYEFVNIPEGSGYLSKAKTPLEWAQLLWKRAALNAVNTAEVLQEAGAHKSIVNRILEPFLHVNVLVSGTTPGWMNFFGLRLDKAAQPEIRALAEECWKVWNDSVPKVLNPDQWHLPFVDDQYQEEINGPAGNIWIEALGIPKIEIAKQVSTACCAHLSYESFETGARMGIEQCLNIHKRLVGSIPIHASPAEHQATPDTVNYWVQSKSNPELDRIVWSNPEKGGNLGPGWIQYRKTLPNEAVAPLPEGYTINQS